MKRIVTLMLAAALGFAMASPASALDVNVKGDFTQGFVYNQSTAVNGGTFAKDDDNDNFMAHSRFRTNVEFVASENLKGVVYFTTKNMRWGNETQGAGLGANEKSMTMLHGYVDWKVPGTDTVKVRAGIQPVATPYGVAGTPVIDSQAAGVTLTMKPTDNVGVTAGWYRLEDDQAMLKDSGADMFMVAVPLTFDSATVTPFGTYTTIYENGGNSFLNNRFAADSKIWHLGVAGQVKPMDALALKFDAIYGSASNDNEADETKGFFADLKAEYNVGMGTLGAMIWYGSGNDKGDADGGQMPSYNNDANDNWGWAPSSMGTYGNGPLATGQYITKSGVGTMGAGLMFEKVSFMDKLSHDFRVLYYEGTNEKGFTARDFGGSSVVMNDDDSVIELNVDSKYEIYPGFNGFLQLGYMIPDFSDETKGTYGDENALRAALMFHYSY